MVNYYVISKNEKAVGQGGETLYGVCACTLHDGVMEVQNCIYGISGDLAWLKTLRGKLNDGEVDPVHLGDIIADELYMQETLPLIKIPPMHDPDAEIAGLTLTVPSWVSSIERARNNADMNAASTSAKSKLEEALLSLQKKVSEMLSEIREVD